MAKKSPSYRTRKETTQAIVTLTDAVTRKRRDYWLGEYGSPESRELYHQLLAQWEANGKRLPAPPHDDQGPEAGVTITEVTHAYWQWAEGYYAKTKLYDIRAGIRLVRQLFGHHCAKDFGPKKLRLVREEMIRGDLSADPPRQPWARPYINQQCRYIRHMFKWAASHEMIPASVHEQLRTMEPLRRGRTQAHEPEPVTPVADELVEAIRPYVSSQVWALIELQRLTGARGGELFLLRPVDLNTAGEIWTASPADHKTAHQGKQRTIYFGPKAQQVLQRFMKDRPVHQYLFSPAEAEAERRARQRTNRKTRLSCGNRPGTNRADSPEWSAGDHYTRDSYHRAIHRACDQAFPPPDELARAKVPARGRKKNAMRWETEAEWKRRLGPTKWEKLTAWRREHRWHPHQLRHAAGTRIRREFGLEAAQIALGHSSALITDAVYAERDLTKVVEVMRKIG